MTNSKHLGTSAFVCPGGGQRTKRDRKLRLTRFHCLRDTVTRPRPSYRLSKDKIEIGAEEVCIGHHATDEVCSTRLPSRLPSPSADGNTVLAVCRREIRRSDMQDHLRGLYTLSDVPAILIPQTSNAHCVLGCPGLLPGQTIRKSTCPTATLSRQPGSLPRVH